MKKLTIAAFVAMLTASPAGATMFTNDAGPAAVTWMDVTTNGNATCLFFQIGSSTIYSVLNSVAWFNGVYTAVFGSSVSGFPLTLSFDSGTNYCTGVTSQLVNGAQIGTKQ